MTVLWLTCLRNRHWRFQESGTRVPFSYLLVKSMQSSPEVCFQRIMATVQSVVMILTNLAFSTSKRRFAPVEVDAVKLFLIVCCRGCCFQNIPLKNAFSCYKKSKRVRDTGRDPNPVRILIRNRVYNNISSKSRIKIYVCMGHIKFFCYFKEHAFKNCIVCF